MAWRPGRAQQPQATIVDRQGKPIRTAGSPSNGRRSSSGHGDLVDGKAFLPRGEGEAIVERDHLER